MKKTTSTSKKTKNPDGSWDRRGHWRHYKSGKKTWIEPAKCYRHDEDDRTQRPVPVVKSENIRTVTPLVDEILRNHGCVAVNSTLIIDGRYDIKLQMAPLGNTGCRVPKAILPEYTSGVRFYKGKHRFDVGFETYCMKVVAGFIASALARQRGKGNAASAYDIYNARTWIDANGRRIVAIHNINVAFDSKDPNSNYAFAYEHAGKGAGSRKSYLPTSCAYLLKQLFNIARDIVLMANTAPQAAAAPAF